MKRLKAFLNRILFGNFVSDPEPDQKLEQKAAAPAGVSVPGDGTYFVSNGIAIRCEGLKVPEQVIRPEPGLYVMDEKGRLSPVAAPRLATSRPESRVFTHVQSMAHAGYTLIVALYRAYCSEHGAEPTEVHLDRASEMILAEYVKDLKLEGHVRDALPTLLGCSIVWGAPRFQFAGRKKLTGCDQAPADKSACSVPFATLPVKKELGRPANPGTVSREKPNPTEVRPIDVVTIGSEEVKLKHEGRPDGQSLAPAEAVLLAKLCNEMGQRHAATLAALRQLGE